jgi:hypothetical protein
MLCDASPFARVARGHAAVHSLTIDDEDLMDTALVEPAGAKVLIAQLQAVAPEGDLYDARVTVTLCRFGRSGAFGSRAKAAEGGPGKVGDLEPLNSSGVPLNCPGAPRKPSGA